MTLAEIKALLERVLAAVAELETKPVQPRLAKSPYDACRGLWEAAQRDRVFSIHAYIGPGIQQGAGQMTSQGLATQKALDDAILALGFGAWGQEWLSYLENRAIVDPAYVRLFGFKPVERLRDGSLREYA